jgi:hypothetical protein
MLAHRYLIKSLLSVTFLSVFAPHALRAQPPVEVIFDEYPGGVLIETVLGLGPVGNWQYSGPGGLETWVNTDPGHNGNVDAPLLGWLEPGSTSQYNTLSGDTVTSDDSTATPLMTAADGVTIPSDQNGFLFFVVLPNGPHIANVTFNDHGDTTNRVPEQVPTLPLCGIACFSLALLRRHISTHAAAA